VSVLTDESTRGESVLRFISVKYASRQMLKPKISFFLPFNRRSVPFQVLASDIMGQADGNAVPN
jgi:hypothetical protein